MTTRLAVTLGDPAGIGPEVTHKACATFLAETPGAQLTLCGPRGIADVLATQLGVEAELVDPFTGTMGEPSGASGRAALSALMRGIQLVKDGTAQALVTAPISKRALAMAGSDDKGHTEILARELGGGGPVAMAFFSERLKVVLATVHLPLKRAIAELTPEKVVSVTRLFERALREQLGIAKPKLALCGLNPHAGEQGLLGDEEWTILLPAVHTLLREGISITEPLPSDTLFGQAAAGHYDGVVALYHDQGLIPVKLLSFGGAVNVTLGLQAIRTSPDHGTAYDIAGKNQARPDGMLAALRSAWGMLAPGQPRRHCS